MKKQIFNLSIIGILLLTLFSCENLFSPKQDIPTNVIQTPTLQTNVATVKISSKMPRTVLPEAFTENTHGLTWKLTVSGESGTCYTEEWTDTEDGSKTAYQNMLADSFTLATGTYKFSLSVDRVGNDGKRVLYSIIESQEIKLGTNVLNFKMKEATGDSAAPGSIDFTLNFPANVVSNAIATLYKWNPSENDFETQSFKENVFSAETNFLSSVDYTNDSIPLGNYLLKIQLQKSKVTTQGFETINTYSCIVRVAPGLCSKGEYTLNNLAQLFNLYFTLNGGNFESGSSTSMTYNANECIDLPKPTKEGYDFAGWYTDEALQTPVQLERDNKYRITQDITLYAKWEKNLSFNYSFILKDKDGSPVSTGASYSVDSDKFATIKVFNPNDSDEIWSYLIESNDENVSFTEGYNYTISVDLKATEQTVVGIAAAETDMFFTVGNEWKTYSFETGYLKANSQNGISIGTGLSKTVYVSNLVITETTDQSNLPILSFYISKEGITSYLQGNPNNDIIQVEKTTESTNNNSGYKLTLNSTGVSLQLRDYISNTGLSKASFNMNSSNQNLKTSIVAKTTNSEQFAKTWNTPTEIGTDTKTCNVFVPVYTANEEYIIDGILSEGQTAGDVIEISNYKIENITTLDNTGKVFAIKTDSTWNKSTTLPFTQQVTIQPRSDYVYDVLLMDSFATVPNDESDWNECIRFLNTSEDTDNFIFTFTSENNNTTYKIVNKTEEELTLNITLTDEYKVEIKDASIVSTWNELSDKITNTSISKFVIAENLTATKTIYVTKPIKITAQRDVKISREKNDDGSAFTGTFFVINGVANGIQGSLELGSEDYKITVDGGKDDNITASGTLIWAYSQSDSLTLTNCILQNNSGAEEGGAVKIEKPFTMYGGSITNCTASKTGGAVHIAIGGSFTMYDDVTISNCTANQNGGAVHIGYGGVFNMESGTISDCTAPEGGALYIWQGDPNTVTMNDGTIRGCTANSAGGAVYINKGNFTMNGGTISGCKAPSGAGVYVATGSLTVDETSTIKDNICDEINCGASINGAGSVIIAGVTQNSSDITQNIINGELQDIPSGGTTSTYSVGDVYPIDGTPIGVVFKTDTEYVYIIGLEEEQLGYGTRNCVTQIQENAPTTNNFNNEFNGCQNMTNWYSFITTNSADFSSDDFPAFYYCLTYRDTEGEAGTWYLPASQELSIIQSNIETLNSTLTSQNATTLATSFSYWSSTYTSAGNAYIMRMSSGTQDENSLSTPCYVRPCKRINITDGSSEVLIGGLGTANAVSVISNISAGEHYIKLASNVIAYDLETDIYDELYNLLDDEGNPTAFVYLDLSSTQIQELPPQTFYRLTSLKGITLPSTIQTIDASAFQGCINLTKFVVPADNQYFTVDESKPAILLSKYKSKLISYPSATKDYTIPENITSLAEYAFGDATNLTSVTIHADLTDIPSNAFYGAWSLETFTVDTSNSKYTTDDSGQILLSKDEKELISWPYAFLDVSIPDSVTKIADYALAETGITSVVLNNVQEIGDYAFYCCLGYDGTNFTELTIPDSVTKIGKYAFYGCENLEKVEFADSNNWTVKNDEGLTESVTVTNFDVTNLTYASDDDDQGYADYTWEKDSSSGSGGGIANYTDTNGISISGSPLTNTSLVTVISEETYIDCSVEVNGVFGLYWDGSVTLSPFAIGQYEVTQELYEAIMDKNPSTFTSSANITSGEIQELRPVETVSWYEAVAFCNELTEQTMGKSYCVYYTDESLLTVYTTDDASDKNLPYFDQTKKGYRLPTEAEWEFAARGGDTTQDDWTWYIPGNSGNSSDDYLNYAWFVDNSETITHQVGKKTPNILDLYDMAGNVQEWCWDYYEENFIPENLEVTNPTGSEDSVSRVIRGGYYYDSHSNCSNFSRVGWRPEPLTNADGTIGFRICRSL
ncbi:MAG: SUMF1/EgtB/PvdO family nonheme iron enzyme [Treponemataceae bacterium]|nr:SUMF1/EgtB/PvdO family nonheme iron enzyme [Treponemataceae bacterium]